MAWRLYLWKNPLCSNPSFDNNHDTNGISKTIPSQRSASGSYPYTNPGNLFLNVRTQLIGCQKAERHREYHKISHCTSEEKHNCSQKEYPTNIPFFILIQSRTDELPYFLHQVRKSQRQSQPKRSCHVSEELGCQFDIDDLHMKIIITEIRQYIKPGTYIDQPLV